MKITKYILGLALLALGISMTSCDKENEGAVYDSSLNNVSWETNKVELVTDESTVELPMQITRTHKAGTLTVHYTVKEGIEVKKEDGKTEIVNRDGGVFTDDCNGTVTFADGEVIKVVNIKANIKEKGVKYVYTMTLDEAAQKDVDINYSKNLNQEVKVAVLQYSWVDAGTCMFADYNFYEDPAIVENVQVIRALESKNPYIFRIVKPYQALSSQPDYEEDAEFFADADDIEFYLNEDGSPSHVKETITIVPGDVIYDYFTEGDYAGYCKFNYKNGVFSVNHLLEWYGGLYTGMFAFIWEPPILE